MIPKSTETFRLIGNQYFPFLINILCEFSNISLYILYVENSQIILFAYEIYQQQIPITPDMSHKEWSRVF